MIDIVLESINHLIRNGLSWATAIGIIIVLLKQKKMRRLINRQLPRLIRSQEDDRNERMERKLDMLLQERGIVWNGQPQTLRTAHVNYRKWFSSLRKDFNQVNQRRRKNMSRKLLLMLFGTVVMVLGQFGINLDPETVIGMGSLIISAILGQAVVDTNGVGQYAPLKEKFKSKKLWTALIGSIFIVLNDYYSLGVSTEVIYWIVGIGVTYILGKSAVSVVQASKNAGGTNEHSEPTITIESNK